MNAGATTELRPAAVESVADPARAALLLDPLRAEIVRRLAEPASATEVAGKLGEPRQKVNYHVRQLAAAGLLRPAGRRTKRNLIEQRWVATASSYVLAPEVLGPVRPDLGAIADRASAAYLLARAGRLESEVGEGLRRAAVAGKRLSTLTLDAELAFASAGERAAFARALEEAVAAVIRGHTAPPERPGARRFRLVVGCYPIPLPEPPSGADSGPGADDDERPAKGAETPGRPPREEER
jgi:DNA-binding transcriptional ArsR family regulator